MVHQPKLLSLEAISDPILIITAHPDDIEVHCGGTVALLAAAGKSVTCVLCTSGNRGTGNPEMTMDEMGEVREQEQQAASSILGATALRFLRHDDGDLQFATAELRKELVRLIREVRPRTVITHDPYPGDGGPDSCSIYPDHLAVGRATFEAAFVCAPGPLFYPEQLRIGLRPHKPDIIYLVMSQNAGHMVDVTPVWETKLQALRHHVSQGRQTPENDQAMERIALENGAKVGVRLAEAFRTLRPT